MNQKQIETAVSNLVFGMLTMLLAVMVVSPLMGLALGGCLRLAVWLWGYDLLSFGQAFVIGWGSALTWMFVHYLLARIHRAAMDVS